MGEIVIKNQTTLTDFAAVMRAALYLADEKESAMEGGFEFMVNETIAGKHVIVIVEKEGKRWMR